jgi:hypothetical protein
MQFCPEHWRSTAVHRSSGLQRTQAIRMTTFDNNIGNAQFRWRNPRHQTSHLFPSGRTMGESALQLQAF